MTFESFANTMASSGWPISEAQRTALTRYETLLLNWQKQMNLVGQSTLEAFWQRHVLDSAQLLIHGGRESLRQSWLDIGTGAGFPGLVLAILGVERVILVESVAKKCRFLSCVIDELHLPVRVYNARIETLSPQFVDIITARACAPLVQLFHWGYEFSRETTQWLLLKGYSVEQEWEDAAQTWHFEGETHASTSDPRGRILHIKSVAPRFKNRARTP